MCIFSNTVPTQLVFSHEKDKPFSFRATPVFLSLGSSLQGVICLLWPFLYYIFPLSDFITLTPDPAFLLVYPTCTSNFRNFKWLLILLSNKLCHLLCPILETGITSWLILAWKSSDSSVILIFHIHLVTDSTWFRLPCGLVGKESTCNAGDLGWEDPLEKGSAGYPLQYSSLENFMDSIIHGVTKSQTQLSNFSFLLDSTTWTTYWALPVFVQSHSSFVFPTLTAGSLTGLFSPL